MGDFPSKTRKYPILGEGPVLPRWEPLYPKKAWEWRGNTGRKTRSAGTSDDQFKPRKTPLFLITSSKVTTSNG